MRPTANFALHAIFAAVLAAFAATSAAAGPAFIKFGGVEGETAASSDKPRIAVLEVQSWSWGESQASGEKGGTEDINIGVGELQEARANDRLRNAGPKDSWGNAAGAPGEAEITLKGNSGTGQARPRPSDITLKRGTSASAAGGVTVAAGDLDGDGATEAPRKPTIGRATISPKKLPGSGAAPVGGSESLTVGGARTESGLPTGKRQHKPMVMKGYYDQPLAQGSLRVKVKFPWADCRVGMAYPSLELSDGTQSHRLENVTVSSCGGSGNPNEGPEESITFVYGKLGVK